MTPTSSCSATRCGNSSTRNSPHLDRWEAEGVVDDLINDGSEEQKKRFLPGMVSGEIAIAMTEPGAGSVLQGVRTTAQRESDHYVINGSKTYITNGQNADALLAQMMQSVTCNALHSVAAAALAVEARSATASATSIGERMKSPSDLTTSDASTPLLSVEAVTGGPGSAIGALRLGRIGRTWTPSPAAGAS